MPDLSTRCTLSSHRIGIRCTHGNDFSRSCSSRGDLNGGGRWRCWYHSVAAGRIPGEAGAGTAELSDTQVYAPYIRALRTDQVAGGLMPGEAGAGTARAAAALVSLVNCTSITCFTSKLY